MKASHNLVSNFIITDRYYEEKVTRENLLNVRTQTEIG